jgi:hypothetical protein
MVNLYVGQTVYVVVPGSNQGEPPDWRGVHATRVISYEGDTVCVWPLLSVGVPLFVSRGRLYPTREAAEAAAKGGPDRG